ncbi:MAG: LacI family transcriptional regulator [Anaerolineaceae bacterium]|nr:LacI family transcriptional regulator [Anaerolineaceae bacterium]
MTNLTLQEIANQAGVSLSTVSRVINNHPNVSDKVRNRVLKIIEETGYQPNAAARSLASQRSRVIGLVIPRSVHTFFTDPYFSRLTQGVAQACNLRDYTLSLFLFHTLDDDRKLFPRVSGKGFLDGVILQATPGDTFVQQLSQGNIPFIVIGRPHLTEGVSYLDVDNINGAYTAVAHLIHLGHRRIATITGPLSTSVGKDREQGYHKAMSDRGFSVNGELIVESDFTENGGYNAAKHLLRQKPDAIFVASDTLTLGAMRALREAGLSIPRDIAIVGYDDLPPARYTNPPLTTIRQPILRFGIKAVETLLDIIKNGNTPNRRIIFETELVIRASCGSLMSTG